jgi:uncharacterized membrane protein YjdF
VYVLAESIKLVVFKFLVSVSSEFFVVYLVGLLEFFFCVFLIIGTSDTRIMNDFEWAGCLLVSSLFFELFTGQTSWRFSITFYYDLVIFCDICVED